MTIPFTRQPFYCCYAYTEDKIGNCALFSKNPYGVELKYDNELDETQSSDSVLQSA